MLFCVQKSPRSRQGGAERDAGGEGGCSSVFSAFSAPQDWPRLWKAQLKEHPSDLSLVPKLLSHLLR